MAAAGISLGLVLSGCGNSGLTLAREACTHVDRSITLYTRSVRESDAQQAGADRTGAIVQLEEALPLAAQATSADPQWNPLMTTLEEAGVNSESHLVAALRAQCTLADSQNEQAPIIVPNGPSSST